MTETTTQVVSITEASSGKSDKKSSVSPERARKSKSKQSLTVKRTSQSQKSDSASRSLSRTLKRKPQFWEMTDKDLRWTYAAYKLGAFGPITSKSPEQFNQEFQDRVMLHDVVFMMQSVTEKGRIPVGITLGKFMGPILFLGDTTWFPWASSRNKMECATHVLNELRREYIVMLFCDWNEKEFYVNIAKHGVIRRVGKICDLLTSGDSPLFQTRKVRS